MLRNGIESKKLIIFKNKLTTFQVIHEALESGCDAIDFDSKFFNDCLEITNIEIKTIPEK